jgi:glyoxylase-like metal-dependent hydrolase (beta-lactamase superfamily II)
MRVHVFRAGPFLIDAGPRHAQRQLLGWPGIDGAETCLLTHHDEDHVGNAGALTDRGLAVRARPEVIEALHNTRTLALPLYRRVVWGTAEPGNVLPLDGDAAAQGWRLVPLHTPGHCEDHFVLHEPDRDLVFAGDLYVGRRVPVARSREDIDRILLSLRAVRELRPRAMLCAHRGHVAQPVEALTDKIAWLEDLVDQAQELAARGTEVPEITRRLLGPQGLVSWVSRGEYCKRNLIEAALRARG